jgi:hypothetical protein
MFCPGKDIGKSILPVPSDFSTVIERVNIHDKQVTYETVSISVNPMPDFFFAKIFHDIDDKMFHFVRCRLITDGSMYGMKQSLLAVTT